MENTKPRGRLLFCVIAVIAVSIVFVARLFQWQILEGEEFAAKSASASTDFVKLEATRGEILDRNGNTLAGNKLTQSVKINRLKMETSNPNSTIIKVINLLKSRDEKWIDILPIHVGEDGNYYFDEEDEKEIAYLKSADMLNIQDYATADDCMSALIKKYDAEGYSLQDTRDLLSVRYNMQKMGFGRTQPYTIADDVSAETVGIINETEKSMAGVETDVSVTRYYGEDGTVAPHTIGTIELIDREQYDKEVEAGNQYSAENVSGYALNDVRGRNGIESAYESELRGQNGKQTIVTDNDGNVVNMNTTLVPEAGNTVVLTIDSEIQKVTNESLERNVVENTASEAAKAGSAVMLSVEDFGVLASATYPSYDLNKYYEREDNYYTTLLENEDRPLINRALTGEYPPGSSFKPLVAIAALQEGVISSGEAIYCDGVYHYYEYADFTPTCLDHHDWVSVHAALTYSCNVFFYEAGRRLTIDKMAPYAEFFGLGTYTGVELGESRGRMSNPVEYEEIRGEPWVEGNTVTAAIGQLDDNFTPLQLATFAATIANGGVRLKTHFMKEIIDYGRQNVVETYKPSVMADAEIDGGVMDVVKSAMSAVGEYGTGRYVFEDYDIGICSKTGTAETYEEGKGDHLTFIAFAPYDEPEVAVGIVMEYGQKGGLYAMNVAKDMFDAYFGFKRDEDGNLIKEDADNGDGSDESGDGEVAVSPTPSPTPVPYPRGEDANLGAFYDPEKDAPKPSPIPEGEDGSGDETNDGSGEGGNEDDNDSGGEGDSDEDTG